MYGKGKIACHINGKGQANWQDKVIFDRLGKYY